MNALALGLAFFWVAAAGAGESAIYADDRDHFTLLDQHLLNRQLFLQLESDEQGFRLGRGWRSVALAMDGAIGGQMTTDGSRQSRFHGYYLADTYLALRPLEGLEANLNVLLFNPSASDGYRISSQISAGLALHGYYVIDDVLGGDLRLDLLGTDLGWVTTGAGLLLEQTPLEGVRAAGSWRGIGYDWMYGGRALWQNDDYVVNTLSFLDRLIQLRLVEWHEGDNPLLYAPDREVDFRTAWYLGASTEIRISEQWHLAGEVATRLAEATGRNVSPRFVERPRSAFMWRADYLSRELRWLDLHVGYQTRWYEAGFGPRDDVDLPSLPFAVPRREDQYVTNSFEYLGLSSDFEWWSHTLMLEGRVRPFWPLEVFAECELWWRQAVARDAGVVPTATAQGFFAPGRGLDVYYRTGLSVYPWRGLPHRLNGFLTNKQVQSGTLATMPQVMRFDPGTYLLFEVEAFF